jgi:integrase
VTPGTTGGGHNSPILRPFGRGGKPLARALSPTAIREIVWRYAAVAPHDLRRTFARLAREGGAPLTDIQQALGHASVTTTERYVNERVNLTKGAGDWIAL